MEDTCLSCIIKNIFLAFKYTIINTWKAQILGNSTIEHLLHLRHYCANASGM